jgi:hypothetical protein
MTITSYLGWARYSSKLALTFSNWILGTHTDVWRLAASRALSSSQGRQVRSSGCEGIRSTRCYLKEKNHSRKTKAKRIDQCLRIWNWRIFSEPWGQTLVIGWSKLFCAAATTWHSLMAFPIWWMKESNVAYWSCLHKFWVFNQLNKSCHWIL